MKIQVTPKAERSFAALLRLDASQAREQLRLMVQDCSGILRATPCSRVTETTRHAGPAWHRLRLVVRWDGDALLLANVLPRRPGWTLPVDGPTSLTPQPPPDGPLPDVDFATLLVVDAAVRRGAYPSVTALAARTGLPAQLVRSAVEVVASKLPDVRSVRARPALDRVEIVLARRPKR